MEQVQSWNIPSSYAYLLLETVESFFFSTSQHVCKTLTIQNVIMLNLVFNFSTMFQNSNFFNLSWLYNNFLKVSRCYKKQKQKKCRKKGTLIHLLKFKLSLVEHTFCIQPALIELSSTVLVVNFCIYVCDTFEIIALYEILNIKVC